MKNEILRNIPKIDEVLQEQCLFVYLEKYNRKLVVNCVREEIEELRNQILKDEVREIDLDTLYANIFKRIEKSAKPNLKRMINGTGIVLHTNLGRAVLTKSGKEGLLDVAFGYSNLEYNIEKGKRGHRYSHIERLLCDLTGAESAMIVNNNAAATMICLAGICKNQEVVVSRGELVEIGGSFRVPEIMEQSGCILKEVGTTNKTKISDYKNAIEGEKTGGLMKVHKSNYEIVGFTEEVSISELAEIAKKNALPLIYDMGSGLCLDLKKYGIFEPTVQKALTDGADVVLFSGDKLLGGPQCGIIVGTEEIVEQLKTHPLARVLRVDKMTISMLEATLKEYITPENAINNIPILNMITEAKEALYHRAKILEIAINKVNQNLETKVIELKDQIGGGTSPNIFLKGYGVEIEYKGMSPNRLETKLRMNRVPIICRIVYDKVLMSARTITEKDIEYIQDFFKEVGNE